MRSWPRPRARVALGATLVTALLAQGLFYSVHSDRVLSHDDTRNLARAWMVENIAPGSKVVVEPIVPDAWFADPDVHDARTARARGLTRSGRRWIKFPTGRTTIDEQGRTIPGGKGASSASRTTSARCARPWWGPCPRRILLGGLGLDAVRARVCRPRGGPECARLLPRAGSPPDLAQVIDPYREGDGPVVFNFDWSFNHYPRAYERSGPTVGIYRLRAGRCGTAPLIPFRFRRMVAG